MLSAGRLDGIDVDVELVVVGRLGGRGLDGRGLDGRDLSAVVVLDLK